MFCNEHAGFTNERGIIDHWINVRTDQCVQKRCMLFSASKSQRRLPEVSPSLHMPGLMLTWHYNVLFNIILKGRGHRLQMMWLSTCNYVWHKHWGHVEVMDTHNATRTKGIETEEVYFQ